MGDLSRNLSRSEISCFCKCGFDTIDYEVVKIVQDVCDSLECKVIITSGCRCKIHNKAVGGSEASQHLKGRALDCDFIGMAPSAIHFYLENKYPHKYGLGLYKGFVHIDSRSDCARW